ncbi:hypothetical protein ACUN0C_15365 [Faunimonas sp. B44]|uniref:hypothetical protein n=1 Tax=Faunimonas sp. B44 TaxID=3461493 RepID=UPI0040440FCD
MNDGRPVRGARADRARAQRLEPSVRRRRVLYLSGFDPRGPSFYHKTYREEAERHSALSGAPIEVGPRRSLGPLVQSWAVTAAIDGHPVETRYDFLRWDDIIRAHWPRRQLAVWVNTLWAFSVFLRTGALGRIFRATWPVLITVSLPALFVLLQVLLALGAGWGAAALVSAFGAPTVAAVLAALLAAAGIILLGRWLEGRLNVYWLGRIYAFTVRDARGEVAGLDERRDAFARIVVEAAAAGDADEILLVGHSLGTPLAVSVMARALALDPAIARRGQRLAVLTLGPTTPILSLMPEAGWFRDELRTLAAADVPWLDFSAPPDGACFALVDPVRIFDPAFPRGEDAPAWPKLLNVRMMDLVDRATYDRARRDWARMHFQYLMAGDRLAEYDYFMITAGAVPLQDRYAHRAGVKDYAGLRPFRT